MEWDSKLYNSSQGFVAEYGKGLLEFVPDKIDNILDVGCGTGILTSQLARRCKYVLGVDSSDTMVQEAKKNYPDVDFAVMDALELSYDGEWDLIFSNAVFHWIHDHGRLLQNIYKALKPGGKLVCEFGGYGNIAIIEEGFCTALQEIGRDYTSKFHFPKVEDFGFLLKEKGFFIEEIYGYDRPTPLKDGDQGLCDWVLQFYQSELAGLSEEQKRHVLTTMKEEVRDRLWDGTCWIADYKRLRAIAVK